MIRIVFDLDGTLVNSAPDIRAAANAALAGTGADPLSLSETVDFIGHGTAHFVDRMIAARDLPTSETRAVLDRFHAAYDTATDQSVLYPSVERALDTLAARGHRIGLCTNKPMTLTRAVLAQFGLGDRFATVIAGDSLPRRKPDPAPLLAALDALGGGGAVYVGDSEVDAETADRAGVPFVLFTEGYRHVPVGDMVHAAAFSDWAALPDLIEGLAP